MTDNTSLRPADPTLAHELVEPAWLQEHLNDADIRIIEVDVNRAAYDEGHIPGAVLWNAYTDLHHADYSPLEHREFEELLSRSGLKPDNTIVFYGYAAYLGFWLMKAFGHERALVLHRTRKDWSGAYRPWTKYLPTPVQSTYQFSAEENKQLMSLDDLLATLGTGNPIILDVRSEAEFVGDRFWPSGATEGTGRSGHIPGAVHLHADLLRTSEGNFKNAAVLRQIFTERGVIPELGVVTYCTIGIRASEVASILRYLLGYPDVRMYGGSWAEWGTNTETPIEI